MSLRIQSLVFVMAVGLATLSGCTPAPPPVIPVSGVLTLNGAPLPHAEIKFVPMQEGLGGNYTASGVTDKNGKFTVSLPGKTEPGCCACECKILVVEGPMPAAAREDSARGMKKGADFRASLKNRPIPSIYDRTGTTPLTVTVGEGNDKFEFDLERKDR